MTSTRVAVITTVLNETSMIEPFIRSLNEQSRRPDEIVIIDGGSSDGTFEKLQSLTVQVPRLRVFQAPGSNISAGRNVAISCTESDVIAVTDCGCLLDEHWLERLVRPIQEGGVDATYGATFPLLTNTVSRAFAAIKGNRIAAPSVGHGNLSASPSSRSVAFARRIFKGPDVYPESLDIGEDSYLFQQLQRRGVRFAFVEDAHVRWEMRTSMAGVAKQFMKYGWGEMLGGTFLVRALLRFAYVTALPVALWAGIGTLVHSWFIVVMWCILPVLPSLRRVGGSSKGLSSRGRLILLLSIPIVFWTMELAKFMGSCVGLVERWTPVRILGRRAKKNSR